MITGCDQIHSVGHYIENWWLLGFKFSAVELVVYKLWAVVQVVSCGIQVVGCG